MTEIQKQAQHIMCSIIQGLKDKLKWPLIGKSHLTLSQLTQHHCAEVQTYKAPYIPVCKKIYYGQQTVMNFAMDEYGHKHCCSDLLVLSNCFVCPAEVRETLHSLQDDCN